MSVYESLRSIVIDGTLPPHERVAESVLAERLGVSRTPVREALQRLEGDGLIEAQGRGVRLRVLTDAEIDDLYTARAGLEGWAARLAAQRVAEGEIAPRRLDELEALAAAAHRPTAGRDLARAAETNRAFHEAVTALAGRPAIDAALQRWWDQITVSTRRSLQPPQRTAVVRTEHESILTALRAGDATAARDAAEQHVLATRGTLLTQDGDA